MLCRGTWKRAIFCHYCNVPHPSPLVQSALYRRLPRRRLHRIFSSFLSFVISFYYVPAPSSSRRSSRPLYLFVATLGPRPFSSPPLRCAIPSLDTRTHASTNTTIRVTRVYTRWLHHVALTNYLSSCTARASKRREGLCLGARRIFFRPPGNIDKVNETLSRTSEIIKKKERAKGGE